MSVAISLRLTGEPILKRFAALVENLGTLASGALHVRCRLETAEAEMAKGPNPLARLGPACAPRRTQGITAQRRPLCATKFSSVCRRVSGRAYSLFLAKRAIRRRAIWRPPNSSGEGGEQQSRACLVAALGTPCKATRRGASPLAECGTPGPEAHRFGPVWNSSLLGKGRRAVNQEPGARYSTP